MEKIFINLNAAQIHTILCTINETGPAKIGHVGTNYTPLLYRSYLRTGTEYLHSVTCIVKPVKCLPRAENCIAIAQWCKMLCTMKVEKVGKNHVPTCPIIAGPVTNTHAKVFIGFRVMVLFFLMV